MNNSLFSNRSGVWLALALFFLLSLQIGSAQNTPLPRTPQTPDSLVQSITRQWPNVRLVEMDSKLAQALMMSYMKEDIDRLEGPVGEYMAPVRLTGFASVAIGAAQLANGNTFDGFKQAICRHYPEYDCEYDIDNDALYEAFILATRIVENARRSPGPLYIIQSGTKDSTTIHALLSFDSLSGNFNVVSYAYPLDIGSKARLLDYFDSDVIRHLPPPSPLPTDSSVLPIDSVKKWSQEATPAPLYDTIFLHQTSGFEFLWLYRDGEKQREFGPIVAQLTPVNRVSGQKFQGGVGADTIIASCTKAASIGLVPPRIVRSGQLGWKLILEVKNAELFAKTIRKSEETHISVQLLLKKQMDGQQPPQVAKGNVAITIVWDEPFDEE